MDDSELLAWQHEVEKLKLEVAHWKDQFTRVGCEKADVAAQLKEAKDDIAIIKELAEFNGMKREEAEHNLDEARKQARFEAQELFYEGKNAALWAAEAKQLQADLNAARAENLELKVGLNAAQSNLACIADALNTWARENNWPEVRDYLGPCVIRNAINDLTARANVFSVERDAARARIADLEAALRKARHEICNGCWYKGDPEEERNIKLRSNIDALLAPRGEAGGA